MVEWSEQSICRERGFGLDKVPVDGATSMGSPSVAMSVPRTIVDFEPPHLVSLVLNGQVEEAQLAEAFDRIEIYVGALPYYQLEIQLDGVHGATPEARRLAAERMKALPERSMAVVGGSFAQRALANLFLKAARLLEGQRSNDYRLCKTPEESREWLAECARARATGEGG